MPEPTGLWLPAQHILLDAKQARPQLAAINNLFQVRSWPNVQLLPTVVPCSNAPALAQQPAAQNGVIKVSALTYPRSASPRMKHDSAPDVRVQGREVEKLPTSHCKGMH